MSLDRGRGWFSTRTGRCVLAAAAWTAIGLVFALPGLSAGPDWRRALLASLTQWWSWGLVAPLIVAADRRLPSSEKQLARRVLLHLLLSFPVTAAYIYVFAAMLALVGLEKWEAAYHPQTLMMDDIAALQFMYGANFTTNAGTAASATTSPFSPALGPRTSSRSRPTTST